MLGPRSRVFALHLLNGYLHGVLQGGGDKGAINHPSEHMIDSKRARGKLLEYTSITGEHDLGSRETCGCRLVALDHGSIKIPYRVGRNGVAGGYQWGGGRRH